MSPVSAEQLQRATRFQALHARSGAFVIPNPWDGGSAVLLEKLGFEALATSSGASAAARGLRDGQQTRAEVMAHLRAVVAATTLPVAADLENGFGDTPADAAEAIRQAAAAGVVGGSIEDAGGPPQHAIYDAGLAAERIAAAVEAARALPFPFTLTARCENFLRGRLDLDDTIRRLQSYERAGADVLFAPALPDLDAVRTVVASLSKPVSFMVGIPGKSFSVAELEAVGVRRISLATSLYRVAMAALREAATEVRTAGTFGYLARM